MPPFRGLPIARPRPVNRIVNPPLRDTRPYRRIDPVARPAARSVPTIPLRTAAGVGLLGLAGATGFRIARGGLSAAVGPEGQRQGESPGTSEPPPPGSQSLFQGLGAGLGINPTLLGLAALAIVLILVARRA